MKKFDHNILLFMRKRIPDPNYGSGHFHASRKRNGTQYLHEGLDLRARPGELVYAPISGEIIRECRPYSGSNGILIKGNGEWQGYEIRIFYMKKFSLGLVQAGNWIGKVENMAGGLTGRYPKGIDNHIHVEVRKNGKVLNPYLLWKVFNVD